jgi:hypothetical protein
MIFLIGYFDKTLPGFQMINCTSALGTEPLGSAFVIFLI